MNFLSFMNQPLAWGALAFSIPLILHILNRSRFKRIEWGAMHLLESVVKVNHRRFRLEQLLLLLVRCAIPALLAFALAKPVLTDAKAPAGDTPVSLVILLDNSYSMAASTNGATHFDRAVDAVCDIVESAPRGSEIAVIRTGGSPTPLFDQPVFDSKAVVRRLRTVRADFGASDMQQSLDAGMATLAGMTHARRELIVVSDFQSADWNSSNAAKAVQEQIAAMSVSPALTLLQTGEKVEGNVSIESLDFSARPLGVGQQLSVRAGLRNYGRSTAENARVILKVDGEEQSVTQVSLGASAATQTLFPCEFESPGSHVLEVEVAVDDPLKNDNRFAAAVMVRDRIDVLLVDGDPRSEPLKSETDFLSVALTPYTFGRMKLADLVQTRTVNYKANLKTEFEAKPAVVVLANVAKLTDAQSNELYEYVRSGGAVLICAGSKIDTAWYNGKLFQERGVLPVEFGLPKGKIDDNGRSSRIIAEHFDHPALQFFNEPANGDLSTAEVRQWFELKIPSSNLTSVGAGGPTALLDAGAFTEDHFQSFIRVARHSGTPSAGKSSVGPPKPTGLLTLVSALTSPRGLLAASAVLTVRDETPVSSFQPVVMARLDTGDPLLVEKSLGDGVVVQMATACDADWSDLPMRPFFVPMMQQLVTTMATRLTPPRNIRTGESAVALFPKNASSEENETSLNLAMTSPDGSRRTVRTSPQGSMLMAGFDATQRPGVYSLSTPDAETIHFVASTSREESDLTMLDESQLKSLADRVGAAVVSSPSEYLEQDRLRREGREIWRYVLAALLIFMFLELVLQQRFSRVRT